MDRLRYLIIGLGTIQINYTNLSIQQKFVTYVIYMFGVLGGQ